MEKEWDNTPTVVVALVPCQGGLLAIRRNLPDGYGKLALPGGWQVKPDSLRQTAAKEVMEETGVTVNQDTMRIVFGDTTPDGSKNLIFMLCDPVEHEGKFNFDHEVMEVTILKEPTELAFPMHTMVANKWFEIEKASRKEVWRAVKKEAAQD